MSLTNVRVLFLSSGILNIEAILQVVPLCSGEEKMHRYSIFLIYKFMFLKSPVYNNPCSTWTNKLNYSIFLTFMYIFFYKSSIYSNPCFHCSNYDSHLLSKSSSPAANEILRFIFRWASWIYFNVKFTWKCWNSVFRHLDTNSANV